MPILCHAHRAGTLFAAGAYYPGFSRIVRNNAWTELYFVLGFLVAPWDVDKTLPGASQFIRTNCVL